MMKANGFLKIAVACALVMCFASCQSTKVAQMSVEPYALLPETSAIYVKMPVKENKEMFFSVFSRVSDSGEKAMEMVYRQVDEIYIAQNKDGGGFEAVLRGNFPPSMVRSAVKHIGWKPQDFTAKNGAKYKIYTSEHAQIAFPDRNTMCYSADAGAMLERHASGSKMTAEAAKAKEKIEGMDSQYLLFCMTDVADYLKDMFGVAMLPSLDCVYGFSRLTEGGALDSDVYLELRGEEQDMLTAVARVFRGIVVMTGENIGVEVEEDKERIHLTHMNVFDF